MIALVMRAAAERSPHVPSEIWALRGMQGAYTFVKEKSKWVGPNMSYASGFIIPSLFWLTNYSQPYLSIIGV